MIEINVTAEGRPNIYIPEKDSLKKYIRSLKLEVIHNFIPTSMMMLGADHSVESVLKDIDRADRLAIFTDPNENMGHSLAIITDNRLECYDIGKITKDNLCIFV